MKKFLLLAIAAISVATARAVTFTSYNASSTSRVDISSIGPASSSISIVYTFTYNGSSSLSLSTLLFSVVRDSSYTSASDLALAINGSTQYRLWTSTNTSTSNYYTRNATYSLSEGTNTIALVLDRDSINGVTINIYLNDEELIGSKTGMYFTDNAYENAKYSTLTTYDVSGISDGTIYVAQGVATAAEIAALTAPEPTVLALLALGVAGLALKRRVA